MAQSGQSKRVVMVSGANRGIGLAISKTLLSGGWFVSAGTRKPVTVLEDEPSDRFIRSEFDAHDPVTEKQWVRATYRHFGQIDAIVHNAGLLSRSSVIDATEAEFDDLFEVNVKSPMRLTQYTWPYLRQARQGKIVFIASLAGKRVRNAESGLYSMSKAAVLALAHGVRHAGDAVGIRSTAICPGFVATDMSKDVDEKTRKQLTQPEDVARVTQLILELPSTASVAEVPISWRVEGMF